MPLKRIILGLVFVAFLSHIYFLLSDAGIFYQPPKAPLSCISVKGIPGPEDLTYSKKLNLLFVSSDERPVGLALSEMNGAIMSLDPNTLELKNLTTNFPSEFHPHGIGLWETETQTILYAINHLQNSSTIEVFSWTEGGLKHEKTIQDETIISPNDIIPIDSNKFYLSHDQGSDHKWLKAVEAYSRVGRGKVTFYDSEKFKEVISNIRFSNGIYTSADRTKLYVASMMGKKVDVFNVKSNNELSLHKTIPLNVAPDNISLAENGDLLVVAHTNLFDTQAHVSDRTKLSPFEVIRIADPHDEAHVSTVMFNDGSLASGASVAQEVGSYIFIGTIFQDQVLRCVK